MGGLFHIQVSSSKFLQHISRKFSINMFYCASWWMHNNVLLYEQISQYLYFFFSLNWKPSQMRLVCRTVTPLTLDACFSDWKSGMSVPADIAIAYLIQGSFYGHSIYATIYMDAWRKDSAVMVVHHIITLALICFSYAFRYLFCKGTVFQDIKQSIHLCFAL